MRLTWPKVKLSESLSIHHKTGTPTPKLTPPSFYQYYKTALLKTGKLKCDDLTDEESEQADDCMLEIILREIINNQNAQIQAMRAILEAKNYPQESDCKVPMAVGDVDMIDNGGLSDGENVVANKEEFTSVSLGTSNDAIQKKANGVLLFTASLMMLTVYLS